MRFTIEELAKTLGMTAEGDLSLKVTGLAEPAEAGQDELALAARPEYVEALGQGEAKAALLAAGTDWRALGLRAAILAYRPRYAMAGLTGMMDPGPGYSSGVHPQSAVSSEAELGQGVSVGAFAVIEPGARIGAGSVIGPQSYVGRDAVIGQGALLHAGVRIMARVRIGSGFIAQSGATIGGDGFSFVTPELSGVEKARASLGEEGNDQAQTWARIASLGSVQIGDNVEIGAGSTIDKGTIRDTRVGDGCKIDNLVQIGHNVVIGQDCLICAHAAIAGSTVLGRNVVVGGKAGISDNLKIGDRAILAGATMALSNVPSGRVMMGYPAMKMDSHVEAYKGLRRLPRLFRDVAELKKAVSKLLGND